MNKRTTIAASLFAVISFLIFGVSIFVNRGYFTAIAYDNIYLYECKQFAAIMLLFLTGFVFMLGIRRDLSLSWVILFSFPCGICLWCFVSFIELLIGIPYTMGLTVLLLAVLLLLTWGLNRHFSGKCISHTDISACLNTTKADFYSGFPFFLLFAGLAFLASSGFVYSFVSYDSFFYFTNYGHTLATIGNFKEIAGNNSFTLTNISQFLPILNAYTSFWGLDQCYQIQAVLAANVAACFCYGLYCYTSARVYSGIFTLLLVSSTSFITVSSWVLANMYCMAYIFFLFLAAFLVHFLKTGQKEMPILIGMYFTALTLLRKDGIIFAAFFFVAFCTISLFSKKKLALVFLPAVAAEISWLFYVRVVLDARVSQAVYSSIANNKNIFFVACVILGAYLYLLAGHGLLQWFHGKIGFCTEYAMLFCGMMLLFILSFLLKDANTIIDNVDFVIRNMFRYPSSWGISGLVFALLLALSLIARPRLDYLHFVWSGYAFLNLISYCLVDSKWFWQNWDDSYNRVLLQIVPVFVFIMAVKILPLLQSDIPNRSSES